MIRGLRTSTALICSRHRTPSRESTPVSFFNDVLKDDMQRAFCDPDIFGESVIYTKKSGTARTINAVVDRFPPQIGEGGMTAPSFIITVTNDATSGISSSEVDYGGDTITVAQRIGGVAK